MPNKPFKPQSLSQTFAGQHVTSFSQLIDDLDKERAAQQEEFLKREREAQHSLPLHHKKPSQPVKQKAKPKVLTFEEKLEITYQWLEEHFPHLFPDNDYIPLDIFILRDLKNDYKNNGPKQGYPQELVIKAALVRYKESAGYLKCLKAGVSRYNLAGEVCGMVTEDEEAEARRMLEIL